MDIYAKRKGNWIQVASHTVVDPEWRAEQMSRPMNLTPQIRERILAAREAVWKAWFTNDRATLEKLIPEETIAIDTVRQDGLIELQFSQTRRGSSTVVESSCASSFPRPKSRFTATR